MASKDVSTQKLVNELESVIKSAKTYLALTDETLETYQDIAKLLKTGFGSVDKNSSKGLLEFNKLLKDTTALTIDQEKVNQEKIKTEQVILKKEQELSKARIIEIKEKQELHKLAQQGNKTRREVAKEKERQRALFNKTNKNDKKEIDAYQKKSKELNENRKAYKALAAAQQGTTKEGKKLLKNITALDKELKEIDATVGQNQRTVGQYENAVKGLNKTIGKLGIAAVISKGVELLTGAFGDSREGALALKLQMVSVTETIKVLVNNVIKSMPGFIELFEALKGTFTDIPIQAKIMAKEIEKALTLTSSGKRTVQEEIEALEKTLTGASFQEGIKKIQKAFENTGDSTEKAIKKQKEYLKLQLATTISIAKQEKALAGLQEQRQILQDKSDDDTIGFLTREKFVEEARIKALDFEEKKVKLAKTREKLAFQAVKQDLIRAGISVNSIETSEQLIALIKENDLAKKVSDENDEAFTAAYLERVEAVVESESFKRDQGEKFRKTARDAFEQELDILEEFTEKTIQSNLDIINSEEATREQKKKALEENKRLTKELYEASIELIRKQAKESIDLRTDLTDQQKEEQKLLLDNLDAQKLLNEADANALFILIRKLDLGEIEEKRLKETIKLKKDLTKANDDVIKSDKDLQKTREEIIEKGAEVIETVLANSREKQNKELDAEIDAIENRINDVQNAIENGSSGAAQSLAELEQKKIEAEKQKEELRKKEIRDQKIIAGLQLLASNDGNVGKTIGDVSLLLAALSNLPSFFDGTENTGTVSNPLDSNGGRTVMLHDNERVMTAKQNAKIGGISNEDLADLGAMHKTGALNGGTTIIQADNQELIQEVKQMAKAIKSIPIQDYNYDSKGKYHEQVIKANNKKEIIKTRANNLFK
jgi:hypothetical protein